MLIIYFLLPGILITCNSSSLNKTGALLEVQSCLNDPSNKYVTYIPSHSEECKAMPLIIILDPHGAGSFAIKHFLYTSENYQCMLAASNLVKNNFEGFMPAIESLIADVRKKYPVGPEVFIAGFSGGARMALTYAQNHKVDGVMASGALSTPEQIASIHATIFASAGLADFNFPEVATYIFDETHKPSNLRLEIVGDIHEWPDSMNIYRAMGSVIFSDNRMENNCFQKKIAIKTFAASNKALVDSLYKSNLLINTRLVCENLLVIPNLPEKKFFEEMLESVNKDTKLQSELIRLRKSLEFEYKVREAYYSAFNSQDSTWWKNEIEALNYKISNADDVYMKYAYRRIKAFLGIVCYSVTNNALRTDNLVTVAKTLEIYKLVEPNNPDMYYFSSLYALKCGNKKVIRNYLQLAVKNGFEDLELIRKEFPSEYTKEISGK